MLVDPTPAHPVQEVPAPEPPVGPEQRERADVDALEAGAPVVDLPLAAVPHDPFFAVRIALLVLYAGVYAWWTATQGLLLDRISVTISVGVFLLCAFAGKPWRRWATLALDATLYALMWFCYEMTRGAADRIGFPYQGRVVRDIDRVLFLGTDPNVWVQERFYGSDVRWYDNVASSVYYTHFVVPVVALAALWAVSRVQWVRFMRRFATVLAVSCAMFVVVPTVPPWLASSRRYGYDLLPPLERHTARGFYDLGFAGFVRGWQRALDWGNPVAAMPSLHAGFALFVPAFFLPWLRPRWSKALVLVFPVLMLASLVYFAEHWVVDGIVAFAVVGASFALWNRIEGRQRARRAGRARRALGVPGPRAAPAGPSGPSAPSVLLRRDLLEAVSDGASPEHATAAARYLDLVERYERHEVRLRARADHLPAAAPEGLFAPVEPVHVAAQHRRQAARLDPRLDGDEALTLVVARRERIRQAAALRPSTA